MPGGRSSGPVGSGGFPETPQRFDCRRAAAAEASQLVRGSRSSSSDRSGLELRAVGGRPRRAKPKHPKGAPSQAASEGGAETRGTQAQGEQPPPSHRGHRAEAGGGDVPPPGFIAGQPSHERGGAGGSSAWLWAAGLGSGPPAYERGGRPHGALGRSEACQSAASPGYSQAGCALQGESRPASSASAPLAGAPLGARPAGVSSACGSAACTAPSGGLDPSPLGVSPPSHRPALPPAPVGRSHRHSILLWSLPLSELPRTRARASHRTSIRAVESVETGLAGVVGGGGRGGARCRDTCSAAPASARASSRAVARSQIPRQLCR